MLLDTVKITESKRADPTAYLEGMGFTVRKEGRHLSVRSGQDERYRITQKPDGHWVTCDQRGHGIGDNLALVRDLEPALGFLDAVSRLTAGPVVDRVPVPIPPRTARPAPPRLAPTATPAGATCTGAAFRPTRWTTPNAPAFCATPAACCSWVAT